MAVPYFIWNGVDSRDMGVVVVKYPAIVLPTERAETVSIPGRPGFLTRTEGSGIYDGYLKTIEIGNRRWADARAISAWLRGSGTLILGSEPDYAYEARVLKEASIDRVFGGVYSGTVAFMVQPGKAQVPPESDIVITGASATIYNPGDLPARPIYRLTGSGRMILSVTPLSTYSQLVVNPIDTGWESTLTGAVIDTDAMIATTPDGTGNLNEITTIYYNGVSGLWIPPKASVTVSGAVSDEEGSVTQVIVTPRWRWL